MKWLQALSYQPFLGLIFPPFYIRFCLDVDEKFPQNFVKDIAPHHESLYHEFFLPFKNFRNSSDIFYDEMAFNFFMNTLLRVSFCCSFYYFITLM